MSGRSLMSNMALPGLSAAAHLVFRRAGRQPQQQYHHYRALKSLSGQALQVSICETTECLDKGCESGIGAPRKVPKDKKHIS